MAEPRLDDLDPQLRELLDQAAANTVAPTPFDAAPSLSGGHRRRAHRRAAGGAGLAAVCLVSAAVLLPSAGGRDAAPPAHDRTPAPTASASVDSELAKQSAERAMLARVLGDENGFYGLMDFATGKVAAAVHRSCDEQGACDSALLTTLDGWHSGTSYLVPGVTVDWLQALPDGSTVFTTDDPDDGVTLLLPDGATPVEVRVSDRPADAGAGDQVVTAPPALVDRYVPDLTPVWVLDAENRTIAPLRGGPSGWPTGPIQMTDGGTLVMSLTKDRAHHPAQVVVATSDDSGQTWRSTTVTADAADLPGYAVVGPDGRMALPFTFDGATMSPLAELWTSSDTGRTWQRTRLTQLPSSYSGIAYAVDGSLLLADDQSGGIWRGTPDGTDFALDKSLPAAHWLSSADRRLVVGTADDLQVSSDGLHWDSLHWMPSNFPPNIGH